MNVLELAQHGKRRLEVLNGVARGKTIKAIALELGLSPKTVEYHFHKLIESLHISNVADEPKVALTHLALKHGLVENIWKDA